MGPLERVRAMCITWGLIRGLKGSIGGCLVSGILIFYIGMGLGEFEFDKIVYELKQIVIRNGLNYDNLMFL